MTSLIVITKGKRGFLHIYERLSYIIGTIGLPGK